MFDNNLLTFENVPTVALSLFLFRSLFILQPLILSSSMLSYAIESLKKPMMKSCILHQVLKIKKTGKSASNRSTMKASGNGKMNEVGASGGGMMQMGGSSGCQMMSLSGLCGVGVGMAGISRNSQVSVRR